MGVLEFVHTLSKTFFDIILMREILTQQIYNFTPQHAYRRIYECVTVKRFAFFFFIIETIQHSVNVSDTMQKFDF